MEIENKFDQLVDRLRTERDEIRVKIHLGKMEAKDEWEEAEEAWEKFEQEVRAQASRSKKTAAELGDELSKTYHRIREIL